MISPVSLVPRPLLEIRKGSGHETTHLYVSDTRWNNVTEHHWVHEDLIEKLLFREPVLNIFVLVMIEVPGM